MRISIQNQSTAAKTGWIILLFVTLSNVVGHIGLLFFDSWDSIFIAWATMNLLAATIVSIPYRHGEKWAWNIVWVTLVPYAMIITFNPEIGPIYLGEAALLAVGQILTYPAFSNRQTGP